MSERGGSPGSEVSAPRMSKGRSKEEAARDRGLQGSRHCPWPLGKSSPLVAQGPTHFHIVTLAGGQGNLGHPQVTWCHFSRMRKKTQKKKGGRRAGILRLNKSSAIQRGPAVARWEVCGPCSQKCLCPGSRADPENDQQFPPRTYNLPNWAPPGRMQPKQQ